LEAGIAAGRARAGGLRDELSQLIGDNDDRWYAFGFDKPSDPSTPGVPENLTATPGAAGSQTLFIHCDDARRATGYRFRVTPAAGGAKLAEQLTQDPEVVIANLPAGATVDITVSARSSTGDSQPTAPITAVVP